MSKIRPYRRHNGLKFLFLSILLGCIQHGAAAQRSLQDILRNGLNHDPGVLEAKANERVAQSRLAQSEASKYPTLTAKANQPLLDPDHRNYTFNPVLEARWTVYDFGKRAAQIARDKSKTAYFYHKTDETAQEFLYKLAGDYLNAVKADLLLKVAEENLARHKETLRKISIILEYDPGRRSEFTQAQSRMLQVQEDILSYKRMRALALSRVSRYVSPEVRAEDLQDPFTPLSIQVIQKRYPINEEDLKQNPSYIAQAQELQSARAELDAAKRSRWPDINLLGEAQRHNSAVYLSFSFDVFNRTKAPSITEKRSEVEAADARLNKIKMNLLERAQLALLQMQEDQLRITLAGKQIQASKQVAQDYEAQFEIAQRSLLDVLNAYGELANIERVKAEAIYDLMSAKLDYLSAAGKIGEWAGINLNTGTESGTTQQLSLSKPQRTVLKQPVFIKKIANNEDKTPHPFSARIQKTAIQVNRKDGKTSILQFTKMQSGFKPASLQDTAKPINTTDMAHTALQLGTVDNKPNKAAKANTSRVQQTARLSAMSAATSQHQPARIHFIKRVEFIKRDSNGTKTSRETYFDTNKYNELILIKK